MKQRERAGLHHGDGVQQRGHRRGGDHRGRQPVVQREHRGLGDAEHQHHEQDAGDDGIDLSVKHAAGRELGCAGDREDGDDRRQKQQDRSAHQRTEIDPPRPSRRRVARMRDQRIGRQRQHFVEDEQREQVLRHRYAHRAGDGEAEADVEARLVVFLLAAHIADGE
ncbi:MAG: hypothetical protein R3C52_15265 [Hyphomonadaceae bacterium]